tara:strand:+ start:2238 stop:3011 length:774 start_codon:yes stop_codon:yes gene_type:complete
MEPTWHEPTQTVEGELLLIVKELENAVIQKNTYCSNDCPPNPCVCGPDASSFKPNKGDEKKPKLPKSKKQKHNKPDFGKEERICSREGCSASIRNYEGLHHEAADDSGSAYCPSCKPQIDKTTEFLESKGIVVKYEQEPTDKSSVPEFYDHSGGIPVESRGYNTNQVLPSYTDAPSRKNTFISEKAQIPSVSQTGYDEKGSSLHMHLNDGGNRADGNWNIAPIEERLAQIKKSGNYGNVGLIEEIASQIENIAGRLS